MTTHRSRYCQAGDCLPASRCGMGSLDAFDLPASRVDGRANRHALGDERDLLSSANRLPVALFAARVFLLRSTVYNISALSSGRAYGRRSGRNCARACANGWGGGSPSPGSSTAARSSRPKRGCAKGEADAVGYDAARR